MKNNRRDFLKLTGLAGLGIAGAGMLPGCATTKSDKGKSNLGYIHAKKHSQQFNMSGYAAPKIDTIRIGVIGIGARGTDTVSLLPHIGGIDIKALCDLVPEKAEAAKKKLEILGLHPATYSGKEDSWKQLCARNDIDLVYIITPWALHTPMAVYAMEHGKHVAVEVPAAQRIDECWQLVETSERTRKHCMMLENCCYDFFELLTLNMARQGFFGEIIHGEGAYIHDRFERIFDKSQTTWRLKENINRNGNLYPTHGLGPICQIMNINRGDKMEYLVSTSGNDFMMGKMADKLAETDDFWKPYAHKNYRGNMNVSIIRTNKGRTIMLQHDVTSPHPYSRIHLVSGTKACAQKYPLPERISVATGDEWLSTEEYKKLEEKYTPPISMKLGEMAKQIGGHGGMDFLINWRLIDCLRNGLPLDMDVYDAAAYSCIAPLSEWSVANRSNSIDVPDFTMGGWEKNQPAMDIQLQRGGTTKAKV
jgi:Oxidoreductase family, NAD-binding Rossmann fold